jgi:flavorubredoxin
MPAIEIKNKVYWIGVNDRTTDLFEGMWPIHEEGVSYNSYLINDKKKAIVDLAKGIKTDEFFSRIREVLPPTRIDYIIVNHMEPDHTGVLRTLTELAPQAQILGSEKAVQMLDSFYGITRNTRAVKDGETLSLGSHELVFYSTPYVHWPETMMTFDRTTGILFSCDGFGGYGALRGAIFDDDYEDLDFYIKESLRYYVNIVANFSKPTLQAIGKLASVPVEIIAPSHGLIWRKDPGRIVELYKKWAEYATGPGERGITLLYGTMYGNTEQMMNAVAQGIARAGLPLVIFDVARTHPSYVLPHLWVNDGVVIGAPTYEGALFLPMVDALNTAMLKRVTNKKLAYFGSYGWGGGALRRLKAMVAPAKWNLTDTLEWSGAPTAEELKKGEEFGEKFGNLVKA